jgi:hypothetical protein
LEVTAVTVIIVLRMIGRFMRMAWTDIAVYLQRRSAEDGASLHHGLMSMCRSREEQRLGMAWSRVAVGSLAEDALRVGHRRSGSVPLFLNLWMLSVE